MQLRKHGFLGAAQGVAQGAGAHWAVGMTLCGDAMPQVEQPLFPPNTPAMLTLQAPRATARLRVNVKGFNMGEKSPWQSLIRVANPAGRLALPLVSLG